MNRLLEEIGIFNAEKHLRDIVLWGERLISQPGTPIEDSLVLNSPSFIGRSLKSRIHPSTCLVIDIGGSNTKFGFRYATSDGNLEWRGVSEYPNPSLDTKEGEGDAHDRFAAELFRRIKSHFWPDTKIDGLAIVWSNAVEAYKLTGSVTGVGGKVTARSTGYKKGEFFIKDLKDGDDLFKLFYTAARNIGFTPSRVVIGNDTIFTATAVPEACGGMIASTGANATIWSGQSFGNSEMGVGIKLKSEWVTAAEREMLPVRLEDLMCGRTLPGVFLRNLSYLAPTSGSEEIKDMGVAFDAKELAKILRGEAGNRDLMEVASAHERRAALLASVMGYLSLKSQLGTEEEPLILALDSTLARNFPSFLSIFQGSLDNLSDGRIKAELVRPDGHVSVPMKGAGAALDAVPNEKR